MLRTKSIPENQTQDYEFPIPYLRLDEKANIKLLNKSAIELLVLSNTQKKHFNMTSLIPEHQSEQFLNMVNVVMEQGKINNFIFKIQSTNKEVWFNANQYKDPFGNVLGVHGTVHALGEDQRDSELMEKNNGSEVMDRFPMGLTIIKGNGEIELNKALIKQTGCPEHELTIVKIPMWLERLKFPNPEEKKGIYDKIYGSDGIEKLFQITLLNGLGPDHENMHFLLVKLLSEDESELKRAKAMELLVNKLPEGILLEASNRKVAFVNNGFIRMFHIQNQTNTLTNLNFDNLLNLASSKGIDALKLIRLCDLIRAKDVEKVTENYYCNDNRILIIDFIKTTYHNQPMNIWSFREHCPSLESYKVNAVNRNRYASLIANSGLGFLEVDEKGRIVVVNQILCKMSGYQKAEFLGKTIQEVLNSKDIELSKGLNDIEGKKRFRQVEVSFLRKNGISCNWLLSSAPRQLADDRDLGYFMLISDVSKKKILEEQNGRMASKIERHSRILKEYSHVLSHDFKTPLRSIHSLVGWLKHDYEAALGKDGRATLNLIQEKAERMDKLIEDTLNYTEIENSKKTETLVSIKAIVEEILTKLEIPSNIQINIMGCLPMIKAHPDLITQLFKNLISNAITSINKEQGFIDIGCKELDDEWRFSVRDNGMGISEDYYEKIFSVFQTLKGSGTGLGLSIVKKIVEKYNGKIWLESELDKGSIFYFTLCKVS